mmetsp:Transcript_26527/g.58749  ORF Transcript_26527/g.58749 Transcript_26527/m.58749 type:complete len:100 (+) Transcript_26527:144-443(+)
MSAKGLTKVMSAPYSRSAVLVLYRTMLRSSLQMTNYNFREHAKRRVVGEFRASKSLVGEEAQVKYTWGLSQSLTLKRQAAVSQLYPDTEGSVAAKFVRS